MYKDRLYLNDGRGRFSLGELLASTGSSSTVVKIDLDRDGDDDLVVAKRIEPQNYPLPAASIYYENQSGKLVDQTEQRAPVLRNFGMINDMEVADINQDGWPDLLVVGEWTHVGVLINDLGKLSDQAAHFELDGLTGLWFSITATSLNDDDQADFILGNIGENYKHRASESKPLRILASDFDQTGTLDVVLSKQYQGEWVPTRGRECSSEQMPFIEDAFPTFTDFALASIGDLYGDSLESAFSRSVTTLSSYALLSEEGTYQLVKLPPRAQSFPLLACESLDLDRDGDQDLILAGCMYNTEVETPRLDGGSGLVLLNDDGVMMTAACPEYCFTANGNIKSLELLTLAGNREVLLVAANNQVLQAFELKLPNL